MAAKNLPDINGIFQKYKNKIYRLALSITRNEKEAEDVVQDVFLKIIKHISAFKGKSSLSTWIYRIAYNEALMHLRAKKRLSRESDYSNYEGLKIKKEGARMFANWVKLPDEEIQEHELKDRVEHALALMSIKYRMALLLRNVEGLSTKETAKILGIKQNSVKSRLHRARLIIQKELSNYEKGRQEKPLRKEAKFCNIATRFIYDFAETRLAKGKQASFRRHIRDCYDCNAFLGTYAKAINITKALHCADIPLALQEKIKTFITKTS